MAKFRLGYCTVKRKERKCNDLEANQMYGTPFLLLPVFGSLVQQYPYLSWLVIYE